MASRLAQGGVPLGVAGAVVCLQEAVHTGPRRGLSAGWCPASVSSAESSQVFDKSQPLALCKADAVKELDQSKIIPLDHGRDTLDAQRIEVDE